jgi:hypothetical protein
MALPRFRIRTLMIAVAATAVFFEGYIGLAEVLRWYFFYHRAQLWAQNLKQVESWTDARRAQPGYAEVLGECEIAAASFARLNREHRPHFLSVACLIAVVISPFILAVHVARRFGKRRRARDDIMPKTPYPSPA